MSEKAVYVVGAIACASLGLSLHTWFSVGRAPKSPAPAASASTCVDPEARALAQSVQQTLISRYSAEVRATASSGSPALPPPSAAQAAAPTPDPALTDGGWRQYVRFEVSNPAVKVTQRDDGIFEIKTTDPALRGSVVSMRAFTKTGDSDQILVRVPP